jgi:hypothetical protein
VEMPRSGEAALRSSSSSRPVPPSSRSNS